MELTNDRELNSYVLQYFKERKIDLRDLAEVVLELQREYMPKLTVEECEMAINQVLGKREVLFHIATGIQLDKLAKAKKLDFPLQEAVTNDYGLFSVDETLALGLTYPYGAIAMTSFGYLDRVKYSTAKRLDEEQRKHHGKIVNTFLDDIVSAIIADAAALIAHNENEFVEDE